MYLLPHRWWLPFLREMQMLLFLHQSKVVVQTLTQHQTPRARDHLNGITALLDPLLMVLILNHRRKVHLSKRLRTTLLLEVKTRGMALRRKPTVVAVTAFHHETLTGTKMVTITTTTRVMVAGATRSTGIKTGISAEALMGEHIHKEVPQHL